MSTDIDPAARLIGRTVQAVAAGIALVAIAGGVLFTWLRISASLMFTIDLVPPSDRVPRIGGPDGLESFYRTVTLIDEDASWWVRTLAWLPNALFGLLIIGGCLFVITQTNRMLRGRTFGRATTAGLTALGIASIAIAVCAPMIDAQATLVALGDLGVNVLGIPGRYDPPEISGIDFLAPDVIGTPGQILGDTHWIVVGIGGILLLLAVVARRGERLQRDTEGLV